VYDFLLQTIFFLSLGIIIYILARAVPRITETGKVIHAPGRFDKLLSRLPLKQIDEKVNVFFEKSLRKFKVSILKMDNFVDKSLTKVKNSNTNAELREKDKDLFKNINNKK